MNLPAEPGHKDCKTAVTPAALHSTAGPRRPAARRPCKAKLRRFRVGVDQLTMKLKTRPAADERLHLPMDKPPRSEFVKQKKKYSWVDKTLDKVCVELGFCLAPIERARLRDSPPQSIELFADAVFLGEGLDPVLADKALCRQVCAIVSQFFEYQT